MVAKPKPDRTFVTMSIGYSHYILPKDIDMKTCKILARAIACTGRSWDGSISAGSCEMDVSFHIIHEDMEFISYHSIEDEDKEVISLILEKAIEQLKEECYTLIGIEIRFDKDNDGGVIISSKVNDNDKYTFNLNDADPEQICKEFYSYVKRIYKAKKIDPSDYQGG